MNKGLPPVSLVKTWVFIKTSNHSNLGYAKRNAQQGIKKYFGSIELAEYYIDQCDSG